MFIKFVTKYICFERSVLSYKIIFLSLIINMIITNMLTLIQGDYMNVHGVELQIDWVLVSHTVCTYLIFIYFA